MTDLETHKRYTDDDFSELIGLHKFYFDFLVKGAGFAATAQAATVAIGRGGVTDLGQIQLLAVGVGAIAGIACVLFMVAIPRLRELDRWIGQACDQLNKPWRPHASVLPKLAVGGLGLNFLSLVAAVLAFIQPAVFVASDS